MVSPNDIMDAAKETHLDGREPTTEMDWILVMNFIAFNIATGVEESVCKLMKMMYDIPLEDEAIQEIAEFQRQSKEKSSCLPQSGNA